MITIESWNEIMANQKKQQKEISKTKRVMYGLAAVLVLAVMAVAVGGFFFMLRHSQPAGDANVVKTEVVANGENRFIVHTDKKAGVIKTIKWNTVLWRTMRLPN